MTRSYVVKLDEADIPRHWFNVLPVLPEPVPPPLDPPDDRGSRIQRMNRIRIPELVRQDGDAGQWIAIPERVREEYAQVGRPTPLMRARRFERCLGTPARIYVKREDLLLTGNFKLNTAIPQAYYAKQAGALGLVSETGAGQWGLSLAYACRVFELACWVFWVRVSLAQKRLRATLTRLLGAEIVPSPSPQSLPGRAVLARNPDTPGSLGIAIAEAIDAVERLAGFSYASGSNLAHVLLHQTVIGLETRQQLDKAGERPDVLIACVGGGSNLGGIMNPFLPDKLQRGEELRLIGAESDAAPRLTKGEYRYDHSDPLGLTPLVKSYTLGRDYVPPPVHVGGLRQHNGSPIVGCLRHSGVLEAVSYGQQAALEAGRTFLQSEGLLPAPESCHALCAVVEVAMAARRTRSRPVIVVCLSGSGQLDLEGYAQILGAAPETRKDEPSNFSPVHVAPEGAIDPSRVRRGTVTVGS